MTGLLPVRYRSRRLILRDASEGDVQSLARGFGWKLLAEQPGDVKNDGVRTVLWEVYLGLTVGYYQDPRTAVSCLIVRSAASPEDVQDIERILGRAQSFLDNEEILDGIDAAAGRTDELARAIVLVGFGAPVDCDPTYFSLLSRFAGDDRAEVRTAVLRAITYTQWRQFVPLLRELARDKKRSVRKLAEAILKVFARLGLE